MKEKTKPNCGRAPNDVTGSAYPCGIFLGA